MTNGFEDLQLAQEDDGALEADLQTALRHVNVPVGFADRVLLRAVAQSARSASVQPGAGKALTWPQRRLWLTGLLAAALVAGIFEGEVAYKRVREQERRVIEATRQFQTTERVTVHALAQAREQLQRAGVPLDLD